MAAFIPAASTSVHGLPSGSNGRNVRLLQVHVVGARKLAKKDIFGLSDPYCVVKVSRKDNEEHVICAVSTTVRKKTLNPEWNSVFRFRVDKEKHQLIFELYDENRLTRDDFLGRVTLPINSIEDSFDLQNEELKMLSLRRRSSRSHVKGSLSVKVAMAIITEEETRQEEDESSIAPVEPGWETVSQADLETNDTPGLHRLTSVNDMNDNDNDAPIPNGWELREDANGRRYFVDHVTRTTTWRRPTVETPHSREHSMQDLERRLARNFSIRRHISVEDNSNSGVDNGTGEDQAQEILPGWEERRDDIGRTFYVDHMNRTTNWTRPTASHSASTTAIEASSPDNDDPPPPCDAEQTENSTERLDENIPSATEIPLPAGWAMQLAPNGRVFFIDHNTRGTSWIDPRVTIVTPSPDLGPLLPGWEERVHTDGRIFFIDHNTQSTQWEDPRAQRKTSKASSQAVPYSRDYKRKYDFFKSRLKKPDNVPNKCEMHINRSSILEDSYRAVLVSCSNAESLKAKLWVVFDGETGLDYGGVAREWFYLLSKEIFNPYYGLFEYSATDNYTLQINPNSGVCNDDHLSYFKFIGRVAGMAVYHGKLLDAFFIRPFYKMMLGKKITLQDMESVDSEYYNSLKWLQDNDPEDLELRFQVEEEVFGSVSSTELKKGGSEIPVLDKNKQEYIEFLIKLTKATDNRDKMILSSPQPRPLDSELVIKWRFVDRINSQMIKFKEGFNELIPSNLIRVFDERELEYLLCGLGEIEVVDWRKHTNYRGGYHDKHVVVQWYWKAVETFDSEMKARLLQFVTGTSRVPMNGFTELYGSNGPQRFTIERWGNTHSLPRAHTCFNRIDLPPYTSYHELREKLRLAIENTEGFEGVD